MCNMYARNFPRDRGDYLSGEVYLSIKVYSILVVYKLIVILALSNPLYKKLI